MKTLQIENTREIFFTSKEQYLHLRKVWSQAVNSKENYKLTASHHLIYALLRGRDAMKGFTPTTNTNKLSNGAYINYGLYEARNELSRMAGYAHKYINQAEMAKVDKNTAFWMGEVGNFLKPFDGAVTPQMLIKLNELCPKVELLESNYGKGSQLAKLIIEAESKPISYEDMWSMYEKVA
jgi:hypothetical protein